MTRRSGRGPLAALLLTASLAVLAAACSQPQDSAAPGCPAAAASPCPPDTSPPPSPEPSTPADTTPDSAAGTTGATGATAPPARPRRPSGSSRPPSAGSAACASPRACGFPDAATTGHRTAPKTRKSGHLTIRTDGAVIRGWDLAGSLDVYADDVTVIDSRITSDNWWGVNLRPGHHGLRVLHSTITAVPGEGPDNGGVDYAVSNMGTSSVEVGWCDVSVFGDALSMGQGDLHDNYVHDLAPFVNQGGEWQHTNAVISGGGNTGHLVVRHNTLLNPTPVDQGASGGIGLFSDSGPVRNVTIDRNWIAGGAYALYAGGEDATGIRVTGNVFSTQFHPASGGYGAVAHWNADGAGNVWRDNRMSDGRPVRPEPSG
ncbi:hypothetical protein ABZ397_23530 [Streptomyces sp. NPDC005876]|uniref:hypothetical protein n=1 Tax=Streptomyces sp. NPDC005876 TaxID=3157076 RepID=UPI0033FA5B32